MFIPCEIYYEKYLGDICNKDCERCFGEKEVYECTQDFEVSGASIIDKVKIRKGEWFWIGYKNKTHVSLRCGNDHELILSKDMINKYFTDRFIVET